MSRHRILVAVGTRPELIKLAPVIHELKRHPRTEPVVVFTAQHRELLDDMACFFGVHADLDLNAMRESQGLSELMSRLVVGLDRAIAESRPDLVLAQGDTTTVLSTALAAYHRKVPFAHLEAGLRTESIWSPFPEEGNRRAVGALTWLHFAPTGNAAANLLAEGIANERVHVTGNTVVDALLQTLDRDDVTSPLPAPAGQRVVVTVHRRESFGEGAERILSAVAQLATIRPDTEIVWPVHPNPAIRERVFEALGHLANVQLIEPLPYGEFVSLLQSASLVMTDSGGLQEEVPSLGIPLLVLRECTERPEGVAAGVAHLVGTDPDIILDHAVRALDGALLPADVRNPYGDGFAAKRVVHVILRSLTTRETSANAAA